MKTERIESKQLLFRPIKTSDAKDMFKTITSDKNVSKYLMWDAYEYEEDTRRWLKEVEDEEDSDTNYLWAIVLKETNRFIGSICLFYNIEYGRMELGYNLGTKFWNKGYATEAARTILEYGVRVLGAVRFVCLCAKENIYSKKIIEKLGFRYVGEKKCINFTGTKEFIVEEYFTEIE